MQQYPYWQKQDPTKPLFPDIEWNKPEQKTRAGKLVIIGGNSSGFASLADSYQLALATGVGEVKILLPDVLQKLIPPTITDTVFMSSNPSGGFSKDAHADFIAASQWASTLLLVGDMGRNSETAMLCESLLRQTTQHVVITRDAVDLLKNASSQMLERERTTLVVSFAQLQKIFQAVYYPKVLTLSMQLSLLVDILHKFTMTYPCTIVTYHSETLIVAHGGRVVTTPWTNTMALWRGGTATRAACYLLWSPGKPLEAIASSLMA